MIASIAHVVLALALAPLLPGIINRTKAVFAGRRGQPLLQLYFDLFKLLRKGAVYSRTTTWIFKAGPVAGLSAVLVALAVLPLGGVGALVSFPGDLLVLAYVLGLMRFFTVLAAMDTGSSFEAMGASREVHFAMLAEPALLLGLAAMAVRGGGLSLSGIYAAGAASSGLEPSGAAMLLVAAAMLVVFLAENSRIPIDDPNTHLELTMIHEVMVLDHCGVDLAMIEYAASLKLWVLGALLVGVLSPVAGGGLPGLAWGVAALAGLAVVTGVVESTMARLRLLRVPQLLVGAVGLSVLAMILTLR
jgi:formate hydrogenlyase subunit 4